jgi:replication initiation protein RepC
MTARYSKGRHFCRRWVIFSVCPNIADYAQRGIENWHDVLAAASLVRPMLGISPDAWQRARTAMGDVSAAVTVAAILQRADAAARQAAI